MPQGNPDPYSALSQGLTGGMNTGMNIMQMMQQKAQAKMDESMKKISTSFTVGGQDYLPAQVRVDNINSGLDELDFINKTKTSRVTVDDLTPEKTKALRNMSKIFNDETKTPTDKIRLMSMIQAEAGLGTKTEMQSILETEQTKQERERKIRGIPATPGLTAPTGYNPNSTDTPNMMYGLTGDVPGTQAIPGLRSLAQDAKMSPLETESMLADYETTGKFNAPKDEKVKLPDAIESFKLRYPHLKLGTKEFAEAFRKEKAKEAKPPSERNTRFVLVDETGKVTDEKWVDVNNPASVKELVDLGYGSLTSEDTRLGDPLGARIREAIKGKGAKPPTPISKIPAGAKPLQGKTIKGKQAYQLPSGQIWTE